MSSSAKFVAAVLLMVSSSYAGAMQHSSPDKSTAPVERADPPPPAPSDAAGSRGEMLYENHCIGCHTSRAHLRDDRRAKSEPEVEGWVRRWADELNLGWGDDEAKEVADFLVRRYYKFKSAPSR
jgi:mono/diheme cytochrome c family protein